jgi:hypothetical protein
MGSARWSPQDWGAHKASVASKPASTIFTQNRGHDDLLPSKFSVRESVDSAVNPESTPIMVFVDETGSMGHLAEQIIKHGLGVIMKEILDRKPVPDPHILVGGIGDSNCDQFPIQVSQFEAGVQPIVDQVAKIFIEQGGGGNCGESYLLAWAFAIHKVVADSQRKRGRKGYIFTIGDEPCLGEVSAHHLLQFLGIESERAMTATELLDLAGQNWHIFHLMVNGSGMSAYPTERMWRSLLNERAMLVSDHSKLGEVIVSTIQIVQGAAIDDVAGSWDGSTSLVVRDAVKDLVGIGADGGGGVVSL